MTHAKVLPSCARQWAVGSDLTYHDLGRAFLSVAEEQAVPYSLLKNMGNIA